MEEYGATQLERAQRYYDGGGQAHDYLWSEKRRAYPYKAKNNLEWKRGGVDTSSQAKASLGKNDLRVGKNYSCNNLVRNEIYENH
eukprot:5527436-Heterocapsa_arctica.AAC.1